jgi:hypothetical protein
MLPLTTNIKDAYKQGRDDEQNFIQNLSLFLSTYLKEHGQLVERRSDLNVLVTEVIIFTECIHDFVFSFEDICVPVKRQVNGYK